MRVGARRPCRRRRRRWRPRRRPGHPCAARRRGARAPWSPCRRADRRRSPAAPCRRRAAAPGPAVGSTLRNSPRSERVASSRTCPASSHTRRAGADDDDREPTVALDRVGRRLGHLEGAEEAPAELQGVVDRLHARRVEGELVVAEVRLAGAGGDDQAVVGQLDRAQVGGRRGVDDAGVEIEAGHLGEHHADVVGRVARRGVSAVRSGPATACPSPPGTAAAGTGGGCGGRPA